MPRLNEGSFGLAHRITNWPVTGRGVRREVPRSRCRCLSDIWCTSKHIIRFCHSSHVPGTSLSLGTRARTLHGSRRIDDRQIRVQRVPHRIGHKQQSNQIGLFGARDLALLAKDTSVKDTIIIGFAKNYSLKKQFFLLLV